MIICYDSIKELLTTLLIKYTDPKINHNIFIHKNFPLKIRQHGTYSVKFWNIKIVITILDVLDTEFPMESSFT
jgi:hypothetical protein